MKHIMLAAVRRQRLSKAATLGTIARAAIVGGVASLAVSAATAAEISGAGATFPYPIYAKWAEAYDKETGNQLNYQSIGSGGGIRQIQAKTVTFGASDKPEGVEAIYNRAAYMPRRREIAEEWAELLLGPLPPSQSLLDGKRH